MAICQVCGVNKARFMSEMCEMCLDAPRSTLEYQQAPVAAETVVRPSVSSEGETASAIGTAIIWLSFLASAICIVAFGKISVPDGLYGSKEIWSGASVALFLGAGLNGAFFGYTLSKIGSVLRHLEHLRSEPGKA